MRTAPNEVSIATAKSLQDIYGHAKQGRRPFLKSIWYESDREHSIVTERDPEKHRAVRRDLAHAFSTAALRDQSVTVIRYGDMFVEKIKLFGHEEGGINITEVRLRSRFPSMTEKSQQDHSLLLFLSHILVNIEKTDSYRLL